MLSFQTIRDHFAPKFRPSAQDPSRYFVELNELPQAPIFPVHPDIMKYVRGARACHRRAVHAFHTDIPFLPRPPKCM